VTHACFDPAQLVTYYPRGGRALRGPFSRFQPHDTVSWFESRGVPLKTESDGRIFPANDRSQSIIDCLQAEAARATVRVRINTVIEKIEPLPPPAGPQFRVIFSGGEEGVTDRVILATGSNPDAWAWAQALGHSLIPPVPSLFTFTIPDVRLEGLAGLSTPVAEVALEGTKLRQTGPLLITHEGLSGPAVLKLSAWGAREFHDRAYQASLRVNWLGEPADPVLGRLKDKRDKHPQNLILADNLVSLPRRLWARLVVAAGIPEAARWGDVGNTALRALTAQITGGVYLMKGKSAFKEEFVTCGGIPLDEIDFRTMRSKRCPGLFFAGEIIDVDGLTGGFNFQNAWTTGWIAGQAAVSG
jgi:predicted Rossmann fold flavoprotein